MITFKAGDRIEAITTSEVWRRGDVGTVTDSTIYIYGKCAVRIDFDVKRHTAHAQPFNASCFRKVAEVKNWKKELS